MQSSPFAHPSSAAAGSEPSPRQGSHGPGALLAGWDTMGAERAQSTQTCKADTAAPQGSCLPGKTPRASGREQTPAPLQGAPNRRGAPAHPHSHSRALWEGRMWSWAQLDVKVTEQHQRTRLPKGSKSLCTASAFSCQRAQSQARRSSFYIYFAFFNAMHFLSCLSPGQPAPIGCCCC